MDIIHDSEEKTVLAIIGDVSKYENGIQTANLHDYKTVIILFYIVASTSQA